MSRNLNLKFSLETTSMNQGGGVFGNMSSYMKLKKQRDMTNCRRATIVGPNMMIHS